MESARFSWAFWRKDKRKVVWLFEKKKKLKETHSGVAADGHRTQEIFFQVSSQTFVFIIFFSKYFCALILFPFFPQTNSLIHPVIPFLLLVYSGAFD